MNSMQVSKANVLLIWRSEKLRLSRHFFADRPGGALCAWAVLAFTPPLLLYSYQVWVEVPAYGPRLPIVITQKDGAIYVSLKGPDDPKESFQYCLSGRTPAGVYQKESNWISLSNLDLLSDDLSKKQ